MIILFFKIVHKIKYIYRLYKFKHLGMKIGKNTYIGKVEAGYTYTQISIGDFCSIQNNTNFMISNYVSNQLSVIIENNVYLGSGCHFNIGKQIRIGSNCMIASGCSFIDNDHGTARGQLLREQLGKYSSIQIGEDCWLGANVIVLKGVTISKGAIVAAGAVVNKSIPPYEIWGGVPAKKIGQRN
jgi:acetyltransferase-like isoleucine patch superfamily enzyme